MDLGSLIPGFSFDGNASLWSNLGCTTPPGQKKSDLDFLGRIPEFITQYDFWKGFILGL